MGDEWQCARKAIPYRASFLSWRVRFQIVFLEHFQKNRSHAVFDNVEAVLLGFGFVSAQSQPHYPGMLLRRSLAKTPKILAPHWLRFFFKCSITCEKYEEGGRTSAVLVNNFFQKEFRVRSQNSGVIPGRTFYRETRQRCRGVGCRGW